MKKSFLPLLILGLALSLGGCVKDDLEDLQNQINDLDNKIETLEQAQQESLLAEIAKLQTSIAALQAENDELQNGNSELAAQYAALMTDLTALENTVTNNSNAVFYGNVITDEDFAALADQAATVITGNAFPLTQAHADALATVKMIGGSLELVADYDLSSSIIENIAGDLVIKGISTSSVAIDLATLTTVGGNVLVYENSGLTSVSLDNLILVYGMAKLNDNATLNTLSMTSLGSLGALDIDNYDSNDPNYAGHGQLVNLDINDATVLGDVDIEYPGIGSNVSLGNIGGTLYLSNTGIENLILKGQEVGGDFILSNNGALTLLTVDELTSVAGNLEITYNNGYDPLTYLPKGLAVLPDFTALTTIGGNLNISGNGEFTTIDAFHNVTEIGGTITIQDNGNNGYDKAGLTLMSIFSNLTEVKDNVYIRGNMEWFSGFDKLVTVPLTWGKNITLELSPIEDWSQGYPPVVSGLKFEGFSAITETYDLTLNMPKVTEINAFNAFVSLKGRLYIYMPEDTNVGYCSMEPVLTLVKDGTYPSYKAVFYGEWGVEMTDDVAAVDQLLAPCNL